jgi:hypothetical protein
MTNKINPTTIYSKGCDASGLHDEELNENVKEIKKKKKKKKKKIKKKNQKKNNNNQKIINND